MIIRKLTLFFLFLSYTLVLGHSILPHDHHEEEGLLKTQFHPVEDHSHSDDFHFPDIFHKYFHTGDKEIFTKSHFAKLLNPTKFRCQFILYKDEVLETDNSPPSYTVPPDKSTTNFKKILYSYSGFRAPPLS